MIFVMADPGAQEQQAPCLNMTKSGTDSMKL